MLFSIWEFGEIFGINLWKKMGNWDEEKWKIFCQNLKKRKEKQKSQEQTLKEKKEGRKNLVLFFVE